ncbi:MAG: 4-hydroxythreonine-4-phosphate dehydrogenase PdxA [Acidobacteria bacterium]|jgi:4-hydroxythreonine-4-phosphate dehydrogenase|nr:4-hydroxythreonine-4-phosphate dehydrogenase PdxA [Acidobacteriota bacterium]
MKPIIGITMGDPAGIGSEIIAKALTRKEVYEKCRPVVIGDKKAMAEAIKIAGVDLTVRGIGGIAEAEYKQGIIDVYDLNNIERIPFGKVDADCGRAAGEYIEKAIQLAMNKEIAGIVTAPINKESFDLGGYGKKYRGHTEMLAALTGAEKASMMLASGNLRVIHVTTHVAMRQAVDLIKKERVYNTIHKAYEACRELGIENPKIGVCGLNAHAGEGGIMGYEEMEEIIPAIEKARGDGLNVEGPIPGDTIYPRGKSGIFDVIVAMYHDQGHIPVKLMGFLHDGASWSSVSGVNITIGLPIIRVSVDHGTAFGKAGKGIANEQSLVDAVDYTVIIAKNRKISTS